jgi:hypothetical protein
MWQLIAIVLSAVVLFYLGAFYLTVAAWLNAVGHLLRGNFIRAALWFSLGSGMIFWWMGSDTIPEPMDFDTWLRGSAWVVGLGALATFVRWRKKQQAMQAMPTIQTMPTWTPPKTTANDNQLVVFSLHAKNEGLRARRWASLGNGSDGHCARKK